MMPLEGYGNVVMWAMYMSLITPVVTSLVLAMAFVPTGNGRLHRAFFHMLAIPALYGLTVLWFNISPTALDGYLFFTCFIIIFYLYLQVKLFIRRLRHRRSTPRNPPPGSTEN
ncbi:hypothetical protein GCM10023093_15520 [Nemorincola caseinilytica]|uniref:Uncharacterized protein n=1 Tax=Nemorincola caseinilytica TaxID=2054315 RepID=A0ABP8NBS4_9BACT